MATIPQLFNFTLLIDVAESLVKQGVNSLHEPQLRAAITSACFGALGSAKQHLTQKDAYTMQNNADPFDEVHDTFAAHPDLEHQQVAILLEFLRAPLKIAAYEDVHPDPYGQAQTAIFVAKAIEQKLASIT